MVQRLSLVLMVLGVSTILVLSYYSWTEQIQYAPPSPRPQAAINIFSTFPCVSNETNQLCNNTTVYQERCIAENICRNLSENSNIFYYNRTSFYSLLDKPVDFNVTINHPFPVVPRLVHFVLFSDGNRKLQFYTMIAVLAASKFAKPEKIFFWHDNLPIGKYWEETQRKVNNLYLVRRPRPTSIYGNPVKVVEHVADVVRLEALLEYGGMYLDTDSIVVNPIDPLLYYDVTMGHAVPSTLANAIMFSKPWSDFFKIWHKEYKNFNDKDWGGMSVFKPKQLSDKYPNLIHIEPTSLCRPNHNERRYIFGKHQLWDYKNRNFVVHLYMRFGRWKRLSPLAITIWNTTAGSIMRYIYYGNSSLWH